jgi:hypothetical protein
MPAMAQRQLVQSTRQRRFQERKIERCKENVIRGPGLNQGLSMEGRCRVSAPAPTLPSPASGGGFFDFSSPASGGGRFFDLPSPASAGR